MPSMINENVVLFQSPPVLILPQPTDDDDRTPQALQANKPPQAFQRHKFLKSMFHKE
jgi:hypothetical protein